MCTPRKEGKGEGRIKKTKKKKQEILAKNEITRKKGNEFKTGGRKGGDRSRGTEAVSFVRGIKKKKKSGLVQTLERNGAKTGRRTTGAKKTTLTWRGRRKNMPALQGKVELKNW